MLIKTHLAIIIFALLFFLPAIEYKFIFVTIAIIATFIPDIDNGFSTLGKKPFFKPLQFFTKHRGIIHSFTFCIIVTGLFLLFFPIGALGFFLAYSLHLFADSFTVDGIQPFWPWKKKVSGEIRVGRIAETSIFVFFILADLLLFLYRFVV